MIAHGLPKLLDMLGENPFFPTVVEGLGFPFPNLFAWLVVEIQVSISLFVILGLWTRPSAIISGFIIAFGVFNLHWSDGFYTMESGILYSIVFVILVLTGPGKISIDRMIRREK